MHLLIILTNRISFKLVYTHQLNIISIDNLLFNKHKKKMKFLSKFYVNGLQLIKKIMLNFTVIQV
jgi:hypothetical protein